MWVCESVCLFVVGGFRACVRACLRVVMLCRALYACVCVWLCVCTKKIEMKLSLKELFDRATHSNGVTFPEKKTIQKKKSNTQPTVGGV